MSFFESQQDCSKSISVSGLTERMKIRRPYKMKRFTLALRTLEGTDLQTRVQRERTVVRARAMLRSWIRGRCENFQQTTGSPRFRLPPLLSRNTRPFSFLNTKKPALSTQSVLPRHERCNLQPALPLCHAKLTSCQPRLEKERQASLNAWSEKKKLEQS